MLSEKSRLIIDDFCHLKIARRGASMAVPNISDLIDEAARLEKAEPADECTVYLLRWAAAQIRYLSSENDVLMGEQEAE